MFIVIKNSEVEVEDVNKVSIGYGVVALIGSFFWHDNTSVILGAAFGAGLIVYGLMSNNKRES